MEVLLVLAIIAIGAARLLKLGDEQLDHGSDGARNDPNPEVSEEQPDSGVNYMVNPATGLPMMHDGPGGLDIEGNFYGSDDEALSIHRHPVDRSLGEIFEHEGSGPWINPATGLSMISGSSAGVDVGGNPYGSRLDDTFSHEIPFGSDFGHDSHGISDFHDSSGSGSGSMDLFGSHSESSGSGFGSDW